MSINNERIDILKRNYPWPDQPPAVLSVDWSLDGGGKEIVTDRIRSSELKFILEIGAFFGGSIKKWLSCNSHTVVIAADPWEGEWWAGYAEKNGHREIVRQLQNPDGPYNTFIASMWNYRNRIFPVRGKSPSILYDLLNLGIIPDLIFFDSDKSGKDLKVAHELFPNAVLTGDDWTWGEKGNYPIRHAVQSFCNQNGYNYKVKHATWLIQTSSLSFLTILKELYYRLSRFPGKLLFRVQSVTFRIRKEFSQ